MSSAPGADPVDTAARRRARRVHGGGRLRGQARPDARGADERRARCQGRDARRRRAAGRARRVDGIRNAAAGARPRGPRRWSRSRRRCSTPRPTELDDAAVAQAIAEGFALGGYQYLDVQVGREAVEARPGDRARAGRRAVQARRSTAGGVVSDAVIWARDLVNTPAGAEVAGSRSRRRRRRCCGARASRCEVLEGAALKKEKLGGVLGVGQGSRQPAPAREDDVRAAGREGHGRARRQGRGVRLRRALAQDRRAAWRR